jgi:hypothetical protein
LIYIALKVIFNIYENDKKNYLFNINSKLILFFNLNFMVYIACVFN